MATFLIFILMIAEILADQGRPVTRRVSVGSGPGSGTYDFIIGSGWARVGKTLTDRPLDPARPEF